MERLRVATVKIGLLETEGLMFPNGSFGIGFPQAYLLLSVPQKNGARTLKDALGKDLTVPEKHATELNSQKVNILTLEEFEEIVVELSSAGNEAAKELNKLMIGLSLHQLWCDAFGIKFEKEERQQWVKFRAIHKKQYHPKLTKWLQIDGCEGKEYGVEVNKFKLCANLPIKSVNEYSEEELDAMNNAEVEYNILRKVGKTHEEALKYL